MPIVWSLRTSPSTSQPSMPGIQPARPPKSPTSAQTSSRCRPAPLPRLCLLPSSLPQSGRGSLPERARSREAPPVPAVGREQHRTGIVLEHPAGEVAPRPVARDPAALIAPRAPRGDARMRLQARREAQVAPERAVDAVRGTAPRPRRRRHPWRSRRRQRCRVSSACAMPSPVIGSTTAAASPANSTGPSVRRAGRVRGRDRPGAHGAACGVAVGPSTSRSARPFASTSCHSVLQLAAACARRAKHAEADVRAAARQREHPRVPGSRSSSKSTHRRSSSTPSKYWRTACHVPRSRGSSGCEHAGARSTSGRRRRRGAGPRSRCRSSHRTLTPVAADHELLERRASRTSTPAPREQLDERGVEAGAGDDAGVVAVGRAAGARPAGRSATRPRTRARAGIRRLRARRGSGRAARAGAAPGW